MDGVLVGQIVLVAFNFVPKGFLPCDGRSLPAGQFPGLYSAIQYSYGGSGENFSLPNTSSMTVVPGFQYVIAYNGLFPERP